jgi:hypothetical protein
MRFVLVPFEIPEQCELSQALRWVQHRDYLVDGFHAWSIDIAIYEDPIREDEHEVWQTSRERLAAHLITGQLKASGRFIDKARVDECCPLGQYPEAEIPRRDWSLDRIDWAASRLRTSAGEWADVTVPTETLLVAFPDAGCPVDQIVKRRGKLFFFDQEDTDRAMPAKRRGRRAIYDWDLFHAELAKRILERGGLPAIQAELEEEMKEWCYDQWGKEPTDSAIREKVARYYAVTGSASRSRSKKAV